MNAGGRLPYQLRPNKAVERLVFLELLSYLEAPLAISSAYDYVGFGGPQMEDFRLMHELFPEMKMRSIEREPAVLKRQKFNGPHTNVACKLQTSGEFVLHVSDRRRLIVWLDYTDPSERTQQIEEFQSLVRGVRNLSIAKITLNAAPSTLGGSPGEAGLQAKRLAAFLSEFARFFPNGLEEEAVNNDQFPSTLLSVVDYAAREALSGRRDWRFQPLTSATYADGQQMLTVTGIVGPRTEIANVLAVSKLAPWDFSRLTWSDPVRIDVPDLTLKERIVINQNLPRLTSQIPALQKRLGIWVDSTAAKSEARLRNYVLFQRHYPYWGKVAI
jgi:hypothetical protein